MLQHSGSIREQARKYLNDFYYTQILGYYPRTKDEDASLCTISHLIDNSFSANEICEELTRHDTEVIWPKDLSSILWEDSLLKPQHFYFHHALQITPRPVVYNAIKKKAISENWLEMRIRFNADDVVNYFYRLLSKNDLIICDRTTDLKTVAYLIRRFQNLENVEPVDLILCLIDVYVQNKNNLVNKGLISVLDELPNVLTRYQSEKLEAKARGYDKIRWRYGIQS